MRKERKLSEEVLVEIEVIEDSIRALITKLVVSKAMPPKAGFLSQDDADKCFRRMLFQTS